MATPIRVLILEDRPTDAKLIVRELQRAGFEPAWKCVDDEAGYLTLLQSSWDVILSDYEMPQFDAPRALRLLQERGLDIPFIIISGTIGEDTAVSVMKAGATDYLLKGRLARLGSAVTQALEKNKLRDQKNIAMDALRGSNERFRQLAENIQAVFWMSDLQRTKLYYVSPAYEAIFGRSCQSLYDHPNSFMDAVHPDDIQSLKATLEKEQDIGRFEHDHRIIRPDGTIRWIHARSFPIQNAQGEIYRVAGIAEDITERKRLEDQLRQAQKMEAVGQLAGGVAHDFNNILTVILGFSDLLLRRAELPSSAREPVEEIRKAGYRASALTRRLLSFSRRQMLDVKVVEPNAQIVEVEKMLSRLIGENIELVTRLDPAVGRVKVDPGQLEQILINLIVNARDAIEGHGRITVETANMALDAAYVQQHAGVKAGEYVMMTVTDTGCGMTDEVKAHLFEPFFTTKALGRGTGLGLATCYGIVQQSGGHIFVYSEAGHGTSFKVFLPRVDASSAPSASRPALEAEVLGTETILFVEDDTAIRELCLIGLKRYGYRVIAASNGAEALGIAKLDTAGKIDLVLTDMMMPRMNGMELMENLQKIGHRARILFVSGYTDTTIKSQVRLGVDAAFLQKPYTLQALGEKIREVVDAPPAQKSE